MDMDKLLAAVVVAAISALTFVAYKHPATVQLLSPRALPSHRTAVV